MTHQRISIVQLERYLAGESPVDESAAVERWIGSDPSHAALVETIRMRAFGVAHSLVDVDAEWAAMLEAMRVDVRGAGANESDGALRRRARVISGSRDGVVRGNVHGGSAIGAYRGRTLQRHGYVQGAGAIGAVLLAAIVGQHYWSVSGNTSRGASEYTTYATQSAQVARMTLPDGTRLTLAPNSTIRVAKDLNAHRDVVLSGEAYFDVTRSSGAPFVVHSGRVATRVLGTAFDVRYYAADTVVRVAVASGKVAIKGAHSREAGMTLTAGHIASVTDSITLTTSGSVSAITNWTNGNLVFERTPVPDVLATLGHWYGYEFHVTDSTLINQQLTVRFTGDPADVVLRSLGVILNATLTYEGNVVTLTPRQTMSDISPKQRTRDTLLQPSMEVGR